MKVGRVIGGALLGFLFLLFVAGDLVLFGVLPLNSVVVTILPALGLVLGVVLGVLAGRTNKALDEPPQAQPQPFAPPTPL